MNLQFSKHTLSNGLNVIVKENHHAQSVVVRGYLHGGANWDTADTAGTAAFATGVMRRGTKNRTFTEINETVESVAATVYVNAGRHMVGFGGKSLAEDFSLLVELMTDNLLCPTFPEQEIEKLRGQIITDLQELDDDPRGLARRHFRELLYGPNHPYGRPVDGTLATMPGLNRQHLLDFYRRLHPRDGAIVVVGDVQADAVCDTLEAALGGWQPAHTPVNSDLPPLQPLTTAVRKNHPMPSKSQTDLVLGSLGPVRTAPDFYAAYVGDTILGQLGLGGRIGQSVRDEHGLAYYARSSLQGGLGPGPWLVYAGVNPGVVEQAVDLILAEITRFRQAPVTAEELADAKAYLTGILPLQMETNEGVAWILLESHIYQLVDDYIARYPDLINNVTAEAVLAAAQKYLNDEIFALAVAGPNNQSERSQ